jgi:predicted ABC-type ATPase
VKEKTIYIIAGCNGAGKTTASFTILPDILDCREFVNADEIARGLSPFQPESVSFEAGRIMLKRICDLMNEGKNFAFETTLATKSYKERVEFAQAMGYNVVLLFFWLRNVELAKERVKTRVLEGGHNVEEMVIERRYYRGIVNLFDLFLPLSDEAMVFDNSEGLPILIAEKSQRESSLTINNQELFKKLKEQYENRK